MSISSRSLLCAALAFAASSLLLASAADAAAPETPDTTVAASANEAGELAAGIGTEEFAQVSISEDGRYVAFVSSAQNLVADPGPVGVPEAYVKDLDTGATRLVSRADGEGGAPAAAPGVISMAYAGDGDYVMFTTAATNLGTALPGEEPAETHVYRRQIFTGETVLVDRVSGADGQILARQDAGEAISADGRFVAFGAAVEDLEDPAGEHLASAVHQGYLRDVETGTTTLVTRDPDGDPISGSVEAMGVSPDGRHVGFVDGESGIAQVNLRDLLTGTDTLLSRSPAGEPGDLGSSGANFSGGEGCFVELESSSTNLVEPESNGNQTYVVDRCASPPKVTLVSARGSELAANSYSGFMAPAVTADGGAALFAAEFAGSPCCHLYLRNLGTQATTILDRAQGESGALANEPVQTFAIAANGCRVVFATRATNLGAGTAPDPGDEPTEVYVRQLAPCQAATMPGPGEDGGGPKELTSPQTPASDRPGPPAAVRGKLGLLKLTFRRLRVTVSAPGTVGVRIRRLGSGPPRRWELVRTLSFLAASAGPQSFALPRLAPGRYRLNVHLAGTPHGRVRMLTVP